MVSYGTFISACGFEFHGPKGSIGFAPRLTPENFRAPFTAAEGWGTYHQKRTATTQTHQLEVKHGQVLVRALVVELPADVQARRVTARQGAKKISATAGPEGAGVEVTLDEMARVREGQALEVSIAWVV